MSLIQVERPCTTQPSNPRLSAFGRSLGIKSWMCGDSFSFVPTSRSVLSGAAYDKRTLNFDDASLIESPENLNGSSVSGFFVLCPKNLYTNAGAGIGVYVSTRNASNQGWTFQDAEAVSYTPLNCVSNVNFTIQGVGVYAISLTAGTLPAGLGVRTIGFRARSGSPLDIYIGRSKFTGVSNLGTLNSTVITKTLFGAQGPASAPSNYYGQPMAMAAVANAFWPDDVFYMLAGNPWRLFSRGGVPLFLQSEVIRRRNCLALAMM